MTTIIAVLASLLSFAAAADAPAKPGEIDAAKIFAAKCTACHSKDGKGNAKMAKMFKAKPEDLDLTTAEAQKKSDEEITKLVHDGKNKMPAFKGKLKDDEIAAVVGYVRSLGKAEAPAGDKK